MAFRVSVAYQHTAVHRQICREIRSVWLLIPVHAVIMTVGGASCVYFENHGHLESFRRAAGYAVRWSPHCLWSHDWMGMFAWPSTLHLRTTSGLNKPELFFKKLQLSLIRPMLSGKPLLRQCSHPDFYFPQEETSSLRIADQPDPSSLASTEVAALPSPTPQVLEQKEEVSKRETVDEEWPSLVSLCLNFNLKK